ncbi:MAG TPA: hypothetical protein VFN45_12580 [Myxococcaceae bacterium]|nr:hypothetical protein [Myxococcaceae bacterium]
MAPLLRLVLILLLMVTVLAGVLVASNARIGWLTLAFVVVAGPVAVMVEGRNRSRSRERDAIPRETLKRTDATSHVVSQAHWEAAA